MTSWLNISDPTMVPNPSDECVTNRLRNDANSSGDDAAAAMMVAPAMSGGIFQCVAMTLTAGTNRSSVTNAWA